ncbi:MAG: energy transducer TonB [Terracidiphilus sp.]
MPTEEAPTDVNEAQGPTEPTPGPDAPALAGELRQPELASVGMGGSRWVDYDAHELLQLISDLEDERRWARLREGFWLAILIHLLLLSAVTWLPKYVFKVPQVVDRSAALKQHKEFTYLDTPWQPPPKPIVKPVPLDHPLIDKQTLDAMKRETPPPAPEAAPKPPVPVPPPPPPVQQPQIEAPRPSAVPARPNFAMGSENPADQLRDAMKGARQNPGSVGSPPPNIMRLHPDANLGGAQILSDTQGVDFDPYIRHIVIETERTWDPLTPDEVLPPINKRGEVLIRFKVLPNGRLMDGSMVLEGSSGDVGLDRAAWGALTGSNFPPLPREFHGPYLELRFLFIY